MLSEVRLGFTDLAWRVQRLSRGQLVDAEGVTYGWLITIEGTPPVVYNQEVYMVPN